MLPTHSLVKQWDRYDIYQRDPGFEFTPVMLGKVASFIVKATDGDMGAFAFMYPLSLGFDGLEVQEDLLIQKALETIERIIGEDAGVRPSSERTLEYRAGGWIEVRDPRWWVRVLW